MQSTAAARALLVFRLNDDLFARQMLWQMAAVGTAVLGAFGPEHRVGLLMLCFKRRGCRFQILQRKVQLISAQPFGFASKLQPSQLADDVFKARIPRLPLVALGGVRSTFGDMGGALGQNEGFKACDIVR